jgi:hypothetical protein
MVMRASWVRKAWDIGSVRGTQSESVTVITALSSAE